MIKCLASGSSGNGWIIDDGKEILIVECGIPVKDAKIGINFQISRVVGCAVTHSHVDHAKFIRQYEGCGLEIFKPYETEERSRRLGRYFIQTFPLVHDVPCFGLLISNPTLGRILFATDTEYIKYRFKNLNYIIVEANYVNSMLNDELDDTVKRTHVIRGHMELETTKRFLQNNVDENTKAVILSHLSSENANGDLFITTMQPIFECPVWIAKKGLVIN